MKEEKRVRREDGRPMRIWNKLVKEGCKEVGLRGEYAFFAVGLKALKQLLQSCSESENLLLRALPDLELWLLCNSLTFAKVTFVAFQ